MSAEIAGFESRDNGVVAQAVLSAAAISVETGASPGLAYNNRGAEYAVKLTLTALRQMGEISDDLDIEEFCRVIFDLEQQTIPNAYRTTLANVADETEVIV